MEYVPAILRWLHLMAGVMWIGLFYYFNFVQVGVLKAADNTAGGITKHGLQMHFSISVGQLWQPGWQEPSC